MVSDVVVLQWIESLKAQKTPQDFQFVLNTCYRNKMDENFNFILFIENELCYQPFFAISEVLEDDDKVLQLFTKLDIKDVWNIKEYNEKYKLYLDSINKSFVYDYDLTFLNNMILISKNEDIAINYQSTYNICFIFNENDNTFFYKLKSIRKKSDYIRSDLDYLILSDIDSESLIMFSKNKLIYEKYLIGNIMDVSRKIKLQMVKILCEQK